jgi:hypothetical protein
VERVVVNALGNKSASLREEGHRVEDNAIHLVPAGLAAFVCFVPLATLSYVKFALVMAGEKWALCPRAKFVRRLLRGQN